MARARADGGREPIALLIVAVLGCAIILGLTLWLVASNRIVFYSAPIFNWMGKPWGWLPFDYTQQVAFDLETMYRLARRYPTRVALKDWLGYAQTSLRPLSVMLASCVAVMGTRLVIKRRRTQNLQRKMTPDLLVQELMPFTSDIAPIACIQKQLVRNTLKHWRRQVSPMELLRRAKVHGVPAIEPGMNLNEERLAQYLAAYTFISVPGPTGQNERIRHSKYLGRQIVDLAVDAKDPDRLFVDRMSSVGKAMVAVLAPSAFNGAEGRAESERVIRALNWSAYGTREGMARLDLEVVQETFDKYRGHRSIRQLLQVHHWEYTFLYELLSIAARSSKIGTSRYIWLRPMDRILFFVLDTHGRHTPHAESAVAVSGQHTFERLCLEEGMVPLCEVHEKDRERGETGKYMPIINVPQVVAGLRQDFDEWVNGVEDDHLDQMWKSKDIWTTSQHMFAEPDQPELPPSQALTEDSEFDHAAAEDLRKANAAENARLQEALAETAAEQSRAKSGAA